MKRAILPLLLLLVLACAGWYVWQHITNNQDGAGQNIANQVAEPVYLPELEAAVMRPLQVGASQAVRVRVALNLPAALQDELINISPAPTKIQITALGAPSGNRLPYVIQPYTINRLNLMFEFSEAIEKLVLTFAKAGNLAIPLELAPTPAVVNAAFRAVTDPQLNINYLPTRMLVPPYRFNTVGFLTPPPARRAMMNAVP